MAKIAIPTVAVMCEDGTTDINVGLNPNVDANDKVQAFVDCFRGCANTVYSLCYRFPVRLALAMWGGESGWATGNTQYRNQNWSNMIYTSMTNPVGNIGSGVNGWAMFEGREHHAKAFAYFFLNNSRYSGLISYLKSTTAPEINTCISYIANAGYGGSDYAGYANTVQGWLSTLINRSDA